MKTDGNSASTAEKSLKPAEGPGDVAASHRIRIRVAREESAFVYAILEASEGICFYSTVPHQHGEMHRDLDLVIPPAFLQQVRALIADLSLDLFQGIHVLVDEALDGGASQLENSPESEQT